MPKFQGSIFDVDGVLVDSPHEKAWRESLRELMESSWRGIRDRTTWSPDAFTSMSTSSTIRQAAHERRPRRPRLLPRTRRPKPRRLREIRLMRDRTCVTAVLPVRTNLGILGDLSR
jgi:beta-phosphoglucomutase-like phosphatase (HAD superfamily)